MKSLPQLILATFAITLCAGCSKSYRLENGRWAFVSSNEGVGRQIEFVDGADTASFTQIDADHAKDRHAVYYRSLLIPNADPASFRRLAGRYWRDEHSVFLLTQTVVGADPATFHLLAIEPWALDANGVFYAYFRVPVKDPGSFMLINGNWAKDAYHYYSPGVLGDIVNCDYGSLRLLNAKYAKDKNKIYWCGQEIKGADYGSFEVRNEETAYDRFRRYRGVTEYWEDVKKRGEKKPNQAPEPTAASGRGSS